MKVWVLLGSGTFNEETIWNVVGVYATEKLAEKTYKKYISGKLECWVNPSVYTDDNEALGGILEDFEVIECEVQS